VKTLAIAFLILTHGLWASARTEGYNEAVKYMQARGPSAAPENRGHKKSEKNKSKKSAEKSKKKKSNKKRA
jgi:hypothetical protein